MSLTLRDLASDMVGANNSRMSSMEARTPITHLRSGSDLPPTLVRKGRMLCETRTRTKAPVHNKPALLIYEIKLFTCIYRAPMTLSKGTTNRVTRDQSKSLGRHNYQQSDLQAARQGSALVEGRCPLNATTFNLLAPSPVVPCAGYSSGAESLAQYECSLLLRITIISRCRCPSTIR